MKNSAQPLTKSARTEVPDSNHKDLVWVQCEEYRCMAYLDAKGKWINFYTGKVLKESFTVIG
jgi:hypothetical protein